LAFLTNEGGKNVSSRYSFPSMALSPQKQKSTKDDLDRPWTPGDSIPAPEATHKGADSGWALWNEVSQQHEERFAPTAPMGAASVDAHDQAWASTQPAGIGPATQPARRHAEPLFTLEAVLLVARRNNRVCPRPRRWVELYKLLPVRATPRGVLKAPPPVMGKAWTSTPALSKRLCVREQIEWAERAGVLEAVMAFMQSMPEEDWVHMGED
jgi:hypothetical protein